MATPKRTNQTFSKKFYFAFTLLVFVSGLSYYSFSQYAPNIEAQTNKEVKGTQSEHPFAFLPDLPKAQEISANYSSESFEKSFNLSHICNGEAHKFYSNVLESKNWELEKTEESNNFVGKTYKNGKQKISVSTFSNPEKEECLVTLVGFISESD